jgi:uroporphyrinogen III methyltransferase/synthase
MDDNVGLPDFAAGARPGTVYLVGAGPGDPGLVTVRGLALLRTADVVVYDRLIPSELLEQTRPGAERYYVGRARGSQVMPQDDLNALLVQHAREGKAVVRLKGGDPFVFGRGGEEAEACAAAGVPFEIVPGVTSAVAVPAYAGIPVTHRGVAPSFAVITGHDPQAEDPGDWERVALGADTLVVLMGVAQLAQLVDALLRGGRTPDTPVALISRGTQAGQKTLVTTLADAESSAATFGLAAPAIVLIGEVVKLREHLRWIDET